MKVIIVWLFVIAARNCVLCLFTQCLRRQLCVQLDRRYSRQQIEEFVT